MAVESYQPGDKAAIVLCLGLNPRSFEKTMQSLLVCAGILNYFRAVNGRGYIMSVNFSATRLLVATSAGEGESCLREDHPDWATVIGRAATRLRNDVPPDCVHREIVLVGTDECLSGIENPPGLCRALRAEGIKVNSVVLSDTPHEYRIGTESSWVVMDEPGNYKTSGEDRWDMARIARETGGQTLMPNTEGKLPIHHLFKQIFAKWGDNYWNKIPAAIAR